MDMIAGDRRAAARYDLQLRLRFRVQVGARPFWRGTGVSVDISRTGIRFHTARDLPVKARIAMTVEWPVHFGGIYPMELDIKGTILHSRDGDVVVRISSWNLRAATGDAGFAEGTEPLSNLDAPRGDRDDRDEDRLSVMRAGSVM